MQALAVAGGGRLQADLHLLEYLAQGRSLRVELIPASSTPHSYDQDLQWYKPIRTR